MATNIEQWVDYLTHVFQTSDHSRYSLESASNSSVFWNERNRDRSSSQTLAESASDSSLANENKDLFSLQPPVQRDIIEEIEPRELHLARKRSRRRKGKMQEPYQQACLPPIDGWKLKLLVLVLCLGLLMSSLETTIIGTALISIGSDLGDFSKATWITTAYLITYTGFLIIFARCSDIFGRRSAFMVALICFVVFSLACGISQTMDQLIIFRAFQGIGGAGLNILALGVATEVPGKARGPINGLLSGVFAVSSAIGPLIGGAISTNASWRWVFLLNVPPGAVLVVVAFFTFPRNATPLNLSLRSVSTRLDWPGIFLSLGGIVSLIYGLQQGSSAKATLTWTSWQIITALTVQGVCWVGFVGWEIYLTRLGERTPMLPVLPARLFSKRVIGSAMLTSFLSGIPFFTIIIFLPERFQLENGLSPVNAGVRMLVYFVMSSWAAGFGAFICVLRNVMFQVTVFAVAMQVLGLGLMSTLPINEIPGKQYAYQVILGIGFGLTLSVLPLIGRTQIGAKDHAVNMGGITQMRILGGVIGIGIGDVILQKQVYSKLITILDQQQVMALLTSTDKLKTFAPSQIIAVKRLYSDGFNFQFRIMMYIAAACFVASLGTFVRHPLQVREIEAKEAKEREEAAQEANEKAVAAADAMIGVPPMARTEAGWPRTAESA